jgi:hypothetical protein
MLTALVSATEANGESNGTDRRHVELPGEEGLEMGRT